MEKIIFEEGVRIVVIEVYKELDMMLVILNTSAILRQKISYYPNLNAASKKQLADYELIAIGTGIHWRCLDEDLSLKGLFSNELRNLIKGEKEFITA